MLPAVPECVEVALPETPAHMSDPLDEVPPPPRARVTALLPGALAGVREDLVRAVRRVCPRWLAQDAEDLVQEALIRVWQALRGSAETPNASYLYRAAYTTVVDEIRRRRRRLEGDERGEQALDTLAAAGDLRRDVAIGEGITRCLERQNEDRRRALTLFLLGNSIEATARLLGGPAKRAENLIYRGLRHLRDCLAELGFSA